jgi:poly-gamma-glutamate synthesis protein (capsule biosynthesis protein)
MRTALHLPLSLLLLMVILLPHGTACARDIRFYGDLLLGRGIGKFVAERGKEPVRQALAPFLATDAIHVVNLEGAAGDPSGCAPGHELCFAAKPGMFALLDGFDVVSLENNHSLDLGPVGLQKTVRLLKERDIVPLAGTGFSTVIVTDKGNMAIVAVTDVVNSPGDRARLAMADSPDVLKEIRRLRQRSTVVAVYVHWGRELLPVATERMQALARNYLDAGADIIVGTHPHVAGDVSCIQGKPVVWSLGNFLFDQKYPSTKKGAILQCRIGEDDRLRCALSGHETPMGSYLPHASIADPFRAENASLAACAPTLTPTWTGVFTRDKREKRLLLKKDPGKADLSRMEMYDVKTGRREARTPPMPIRKMQSVDLNGDGIREIMLQQNIYSSLDKEIAARVYLYSLDGTFHALWRGSALSRPLLDAVFIRGKYGKPLLVGLHSADSFLARDRHVKGRLLMSYRWNGFGFTGRKEVKVKDSCDALSCDGRKLKLLRRGTVERRFFFRELL